MKILGIIPARYASTRFPGKPLANIRGKPMIIRVCEQVASSGILEDVIVATDDERIFQHVRSAGFHVVMTSPDHKSGTERCLEALQSWNHEQSEPAAAVVNIQGDEPYIQPEQIREVVRLLIESRAEIATLAKLISVKEEIQDPNVVKVVFSEMMEALYFSRLPVPYLRKTEKAGGTGFVNYYKHIGIYGYQSATLRKICQLPAGKLELAESLEQLRWLENGYRIKIGITETESLSIDTPEDLLKITNSP